MATDLITRRQQESRLLGIIVGAITSFSLVMLASLAPWFDDDSVVPADRATTTSVAADSATNATPGTPDQGTGRQGSGGGPPEGRGPGSQGESDATADPLSIGVADQQVLDAFANGGCVACHSIKGVGGGDTTVGPHLFRTGFLAADRRPGPSAESYIEESILLPDAFIMPNCPTGPCPSGVMPQTYGETLTAADLATIVSYLSALGTPEEAAVLTQP